MTECWKPCVIIWATLLVHVTGHRPVIIVHGILDGPKQFEILAQFISQSHPGTSVTTIDLYNYIASIKPLWQQVDGFRNTIRPIMENAEDGVHLICFSQGGLICRGVLATLPKHNVHSLIFLASPLAGQYGDPHQRERYLKSSNYLAPLNGEIEHANLTACARQLPRIKKLVLIGGRDDGVITPWESSIFGFYDSNENVIEMEKQDWYLRDAFGLKTLDSKGAVVKCLIPGVSHTSWHSNLTVYQNCIDKWLT